MLAARAFETNPELAAEPALCAVLSHPEPERRLAAALALGSVGTRAAIAQLRAVTEAETSARELRQAAATAIAAIQGRLTGAAPGQLALTDSGTGELSLATGTDGELSLAVDGTRSELES